MIILELVVDEPYVIKFMYGKCKYQTYFHIARPIFFNLKNIYIYKIHTINITDQDHHKITEQE